MGQNFMRHPGESAAFILTPRRVSLSSFNKGVNLPRLNNKERHRNNGDQIRKEGEREVHVIRLKVGTSDRGELGAGSWEPGIDPTPAVLCR